jgi:hypothetical protein
MHGAVVAHFAAEVGVSPGQIYLLNAAEVGVSPRQKDADAAEVIRVSPRPIYLLKDADVEGRGVPNAEDHQNVVAVRKQFFQKFIT